jgi:tRNA nucleotidyltransferase (CCA-adding enzyme)
MKYKTYYVGGCVRDEIMGIQSKDIDLVMLAPSFDDMRTAVLESGCKIFVEKPEYLTIRANHPSLGPVDFAIARQDGSYTDGRRPDNTTIASSLVQDLSRRDFTMNAIAKDMQTGEYIDPFNGIQSIQDGKLKAVGNARDRFNEDKLRVFRALRFTIQKSFHMHYDISDAIGRMTILDFNSVSTERIREELLKMFKVNAFRSMLLLFKDYPVLGDVIENRGIWFKPTTEMW